MITRFRHVGIAVTDIQKSLKFYRDLLGFSVVVDEIEDGKYLSRLIGLRNSRGHVVKIAAPDGTVIELFQFLSHPLEKPPVHAFNLMGCNHIAYMVDDIDELYDRLSKKGVSFISEPLQSTYDPVKTMFCYDPDKTLIQFVEILDKTSIRKGLE